MAGHVRWALRYVYGHSEHTVPRRRSIRASDRRHRSRLHAPPPRPPIRPSAVAVGTLLCRRHGRAVGATVAALCAGSGTTAALITKMLPRAKLKWPSDGEVAGALWRWRAFSVDLSMHMSVRMPVRKAYTHAYTHVHMQARLEFEVAYEPSVDDSVETHLAEWREPPCWPI